jgi:hypothetical protein
MGMSALYGPADETESIATIHEALDAGVTLLDTGDYYGAGHNELLIRDALRGRDRESAVLSVKFGAIIARGSKAFGLDPQGIVPEPHERLGHRLDERHPAGVNTRPLGWSGPDLCQHFRVDTPRVRSTSQAVAYRSACARH